MKITTDQRADLARRDEYLEDRLRRAAASVWLFLCGREMGFKFLPADSYYTPPSDWVSDAVQTLRAVLDGEKIEDSEIPFMVYWRALETQNLPRSYASSSRAQERPSEKAVDPAAGPVPVPESSPAQQIRDWVMRPIGRGAE